MLSALSTRTSLGLIALLSFLALGFALFSQHMLGMAPCAWCILQRMILLLIGVVALIGWWKTPVCPNGAMLASALAGGLGISGAVAAWYQHNVAANSFTCDLSFADTVVTTSGLDTLLPQIFGVYATCADSAVDLFGVRYEIWTLILFVAITFLAISALAPRKATAES